MARFFFFLIDNDYITAESAEQDQISRICRLILLYTIRNLDQWSRKAGYPLFLYFFRYLMYNVLELELALTGSLVVTTPDVLPCAVMSSIPDFWNLSFWWFFASQL